MGHTAWHGRLDSEVDIKRDIIGIQVELCVWLTATAHQTHSSCPCSIARGYDLIGLGCAPGRVRGGVGVVERELVGHCVSHVGHLGPGITVVGVGYDARVAAHP